MALPIAYTRKALMQRLRKHVANAPNTSDQFSASDNEIILLIDQAAAARMVGQVFNEAKIEGSLAVPEAYYTTYTLPALTLDPLAPGEWFCALPQPPMSLPLGLSVNEVYSKSATGGRGEAAYFIKSKRGPRRRHMPMQPGVRAWIENSILHLAAHNGAYLGTSQWYVEMMSARTTDVNAVMNMPEDDVEFVFDTVVKKLLQRYTVPQDIILDGLPAGNKSS